jgi:hypothetical protein
MQILDVFTSLIIIIIIIIIIYLFIYRFQDLWNPEINAVFIRALQYPLS